MNFRSISRMFVSFFALLIVILTSKDAFAVYCGDVQAEAGRLWTALHSRNARISQLQQLVAQNRLVIDEATPLAQAWGHAVSVHDSALGSLEDGTRAVEEAFQAAKEMNLALGAMQSLNSGLKKKLSADPKKRLAETLREAVRTSRLSPSKAATLNQLANAVARLENSSSDWVSVEREIVRSFLDGREDLFEGLFQKLSSSSQRMRSDLERLRASRSKDQEKVESLSARIAAANAAVAASGSEIESLNQANRVSQQRLNEIDKYLNACREEVSWKMGTF